MRHRLFVILGSVGLFAVGLFATLGGDAPAKKAERPIALHEIYTRGIEGYLGYRLGTVLSVSGHIIPNSSRWKADVAEPFFVRVVEVNESDLIQRSTIRLESFY